MRKKGKNRRIEQETNRVNELANTLQREERVRDLERELTSLDYASLSLPEQESWWHIYGITAFQYGRDAEALSRFQEGHKRFPDSRLIRFSLGQQYIRAHAIEEGFALFLTCKFPEIPKEYALAQARYAYLWNHYNDGLLFIRPFFDAYREVRILDDTFLYMRGLPFFSQAWSYQAALNILSGDVKELEAVTESVVNNCHDYDFEFLKTELVAYRDDKPELLLEPLEKRLSATPDNFPTGYTRMNIAVVQSRTAATIEDAEKVLRGVALDDQDFPWLDDVRTLALAEAAHRFDHPDREAAHIDAFIARQPMLFEPDIALNFHLLRYQERLKPRVATR